MPEVATPLAPSPLCRLADIADGQAKGITWGSGSAREEILVARRDDRAFAYHNRCPHVGTTLDWTPDQFMSADGRHLQCATHGALFRVEDGLCIHGPCAGRSLTPVRVHVEDGAVHLDG